MVCVVVALEFYRRSRTGVQTVWFRNQKPSDAVAYGKSHSCVCVCGGYVLYLVLGRGGVCGVCRCVWLVIETMGLLILSSLESWLYDLLLVWCVCVSLYTRPPRDGVVEAFDILACVGVS